MLLICIYAVDKNMSYTHIFFYHKVIYIIKILLSKSTQVDIINTIK